MGDSLKSNKNYNFMVTLTPYLEKGFSQTWNIGSDKKCIGKDGKQIAINPISFNTKVPKCCEGF